MNWNFRLVLLFVFSASLLGGCGTKETANLGLLLKPGEAENCNILLVTLDTIRQDRLGCYGDQDARTPVLDKMAATGVQYFDAVASVPLTLPSHATILTGQDPLRHGVRDNGLYALGDEPTTLPEDLKARGYATSAFIAAFVLDKRFGLDRGFDVYDFEVGEKGYRPLMADFNERPANEVTDATLSWLKKHHTENPQQPFFTWVHYFDAHLPYTSPLHNQAVFKNRGYDAEISFVDQQLGRLIQWLDDSGTRDNTIVILVADHGESLGEHQEATHGMFIYNSTMKIPMIINCPEKIDGHLEIRDRIAGLVDLRDTISDMLGFSPTAVTDGQSLLQPVDANRRIYMETESPLNMAGFSPLHGLQSHSEKYILAPESEFYDLGDDPEELKNIYETRLDEMAPFSSLLKSIMGGASDSATDRHITSEEAERLRSLGYVHSGSRSTDKQLADPKAMIEIFNAGMQAEALYSNGKYSEAADLAQRVVSRCEDCTAAVRVLSFSKIRMGKTEEAVTILQDAVDRTGDLFLVRSLAQARIINNDFPGALKTLELFQALDPHDGRVFILRGDVFDKQGLPEEALAQYREALALDENRVGIRARQRIQRMENR